MFNNILLYHKIQFANLVFILNSKMEKNYEIIYMIIKNYVIMQSNIEIL